MVEKRKLQNELIEHVEQEGFRISEHWKIDLFRQIEWGVASLYIALVPASRPAGPGAGAQDQNLDQRTGRAPGHGVRPFRLTDTAPGGGRQAAVKAN